MESLPRMLRPGLRPRPRTGDVRVGVFSARSRPRCRQPSTPASCTARPRKDASRASPTTARSRCTRSGTSAMPMRLRSDLRGHRLRIPADRLRRQSRAAARPLSRRIAEAWLRLWRGLAAARRQIRHARHRQVDRGPHARRRPAGADNPKLSVADGINGARTIFNRCWFDQVRCADGVAALRHYRYDTDASGQFRKTPLHTGLPPARTPSATSPSPRASPAARDRRGSRSPSTQGTGWLETPRSPTATSASP
jgi:hypothetical protein